jgi:hypothetical protein
VRKRKQTKLKARRKKEITFRADSREIQTRKIIEINKTKNWFFKRSTHLADRYVDPPRKK